jgi:hypothetical protein
MWDLAASFDEAVRDQNLSLLLRHHRRLVAASSPTFIRAHTRLQHHCRLPIEGHLADDKGELDELCVMRYEV